MDTHFVAEGAGEIGAGVGKADEGAAEIKVAAATSIIDRVDLATDLVAGGRRGDGGIRSGVKILRVAQRAFNANGTEDKGVPGERLGS